MTCDPQGPTWALSGGVERGTNERPGIWSCDLWANERPGNKLRLEGTCMHAYIHTDGHRDSMTESAQWADSVKTLALKSAHFTIPKMIFGKFS